MICFVTEHRPNGFPFPYDGDVIFDQQITKRMWRRFGYGITFPFIDGKPLKFFDTDIKNGKSTQMYINEGAGEVYHCVITDKSNPNDVYL